MRLPILIIIFFLVATIAVDAYIYFCIPRNSMRGKGRRYYAVGALLCWLLLIVALCIPRRGEESILPVMWLLYSYSTILLSKIVFAVISLVGKIPALWKGKPWKWLSKAGLVMGIITFIFMWYGSLAGRNNIQIKNVEIESSRMPSEFDGLRIAVFSDAHVGTWGRDTAFLSRFIDSINAQKPDVVFFTGDIVNRTTEELFPFKDVLKRIKAPKGVYSILGNHDYGDYKNWPSEESKKDNLQLLCNQQKQMGWTLLNNEHTWIREGSDSIAIIGVENWGEPPFTCYGDYKKASGNIPEDAFKILLSHNPEHWRREIAGSDDKVDLTFSGHTHAMQMSLKIGRRQWSPAHLRYPLWGGRYTDPADSDKQLYVNIGCGEVGIPARWGSALPELTVVTLHKKKNDTQKQIL